MTATAPGRPAAPHRASQPSLGQAHANRAALLAGFLGWVTAVGMSMLLTGLALAVVLGAGLAGGAAGLSGSTGAISVVGAIVLAAIVLAAFFCGGHVTGRLTDAGIVRPAMAVWGWSIAGPAAVALLAVLGSGALRDVVLRAGFDLPLTLMLLAVSAVALVGALLGAGSAGSRRRAGGGAEPAQDVSEDRT